MHACAVRSYDAIVIGGGLVGLVTATRTAVSDANAAPSDFRIHVAGGEIGAPKVVVAAGLGNTSLAPLFG